MTWPKKQPTIGTVYQEFGVLNFGGINNKYAPQHIQDNQASDLMNVVFDELGAITKRNGYTSLLTIDNNPIQSILPYYQSNGTKTFLITSGTSIYQWTVSPTYTWGSMKWGSAIWGSAPPIKTGLNANGARFTASTFYDKIYLLNGNTTDGLMKWDGANFGTVAGAPNGQFVVTHKNRLYIAGDPNNPSRLYMSDLGSPESFPSLNFIDVNTNDGDKITGIAEHLDSLVIFKERSIHVLRGTGPSNYNLLDMHQNHGCISHWSIVQASNVLFYLSRDGVYEFNGKTIYLVSDPIMGSVQGINGQTAWNQGYLNVACGIDYKNKYWLAIPEGGTNTTNNRVYAYDYIHKIWTRFDIPVSCFGIFDSTNGHILYSGDPKTGNVYQQDTGGNDNGNPINAYLTTKAFDFGSPAHYKSYKGLFFYAAQQLSGYSINISYIADFGRFKKTIQMNLGKGKTSQWGTALWGQSPWGAVPNVASKTSNVAGQSRYLQFSVQGNGLDEPFVFYGWVIRHQVKRRMT